MAEQTDALEMFRSLCRPTSVDELGRLARRLNTHLDAVEEAGLSDPNVDVRLATTLTAVLRTLTDEADHLSNDERADFRGAIEYFLLTRDSTNDLRPDGLVDDALVVRNLCEILSRPELANQLDERS